MGANSGEGKRIVNLKAIILFDLANLLLKSKNITILQADTGTVVYL